MNSSARQRALEIWNLSPGQTKIPLWLDCDPGHDDAFSILVAAHCPSVELLGVSTVHGNASLKNTTWNARSVLEAIGRRDVPVYPGAEKPFARWPCYAPNYHGKTGLDGTDLLPSPTRPPAGDDAAAAVEAMHDALSRTAPGTAWLVTNGALTNAALLFALHPRLRAHLAGVSVMGGGVGGFFTHAPMGRLADRVALSPRVWREMPRGPPPGLAGQALARLFREKGYVADDGGGGGGLSLEELGARLERQRAACGNWTPAAEFNIYCDPEAAQALLSDARLAGKTTLIPLDVTHQVLAGPAVLELLSYGYVGVEGSSPPAVAAPAAAAAAAEPAGTAQGHRSRKRTPLRQMFHELLIFFSRTYSEQFGMHEGPPLHDPVAVAAALAPSLFDDNSNGGAGAGAERFDVYVDCEGEPGGFGRARDFPDSKGCGRTVIRMVDEVAAAAATAGEGEGDGQDGSSGGVRVPRTLDVGVFWMLVDLALEAADKVSPLGS